MVDSLNISAVGLRPGDGGWQGLQVEGLAVRAAGVSRRRGGESIG
jgi:hypothetical protein